MELRAPTTPNSVSLRNCCNVLPGKWLTTCYASSCSVVHVHDVSIGRCDFEESSEVRSGFRLVDDGDEDDGVLFSSLSDESLALVTMTRFA